MRFVPSYVRAPNDASEPQRDDVNGTGMLGAESLNGCTISPVSLWKRLISPHGVLQVPKSPVSRSQAASSAARRSAGFAPVAIYSYVVTPKAFACLVTMLANDSAQYTASEVGMEPADQRLSQARSAAIGSASLVLNKSASV